MWYCLFHLIKWFGLMWCCLLCLPRWVVPPVSWWQTKYSQQMHKPATEACFISLLTCAAYLASWRRVAPQRRCWSEETCCPETSPGEWWSWSFLYMCPPACSADPWHKCPQSCHWSPQPGTCHMGRTSSRGSPLCDPWCESAPTDLWDERGNKVSLSTWLNLSG